MIRPKQHSHPLALRRLDHTRQVSVESAERPAGQLYLPHVACPGASHGLIGRGAAPIVDAMRILGRLAITVMLGCGGSTAPPPAPIASPVIPEPAVEGPRPAMPETDAAGAAQTEAGPAEALPAGASPAEITAPVPPAETAPAFLDPDAVLARLPLHTIVLREGPLYETRDGPAATKGAGLSLQLTLEVLDPDTGGSPRRPRVLCNTPISRVAVHVDVADMATVALAGTFLAGGRAIPAAPEDRTPGLRLRAGQVLWPVGSATAGLRRVRYQGAHFAAEGWVRADRVDIVFAPELSGDPAPRRDGALIDRARFLDAPGGAEIARVEAYRESSWRPLVEKLDGPRRGFVLVRYHEPGAELVGWVSQEVVEDIEPREASLGIGTGSAIATSSRVEQQVRVARGALLVGERSGEPIGVMLHDAQLSCLADCKGDRPLVSAPACAGTIPVRAHRTR
jgi:hypothetical protein